MTIALRLLVPAMLAGASACAPARMEVPPALAAEPEWVLRAPMFGTTSRQQFGAYLVHWLEFGDVRQRGSIVDALVRGKQQLQQRYEFRLAEQTEVRDLWALRCDNRDYERGYQIGSVGVTLDQAVSLECTLNPPGDPSDSWTLRLSAEGDSVPRGGLRRGDTEYRIVGERPNTLERVSRYSVWTGDRLVADVNRQGRPSARVVSQLDDKHLMAAVTAALLMQPKLIDP